MLVSFPDTPFTCQAIAALAHPNIPGGRPYPNLPSEGKGSVDWDRGTIIA